MEWADKLCSGEIRWRLGGRPVIAFFGSLDPAIKAAIIGSLTTVITGVTGFVVLIWRLRVEALRAIDENKSTEALKLKLKIYEQEVVSMVEKTVDAEVALAGFARRFVSDLETYRTLTDAGLPATTPVARVPDLIGLKALFDREAVAIITFTERWLVVDPRFEVFRIAANAAMHDVREEWGVYFDLVMRNMPVELPAGLHWTVPGTDQLAAIEAASDRFIDRLGTLTAYSYDFQAEMQNVLIGPLFGNTVPRRQPIDPQHIVISLGNAMLLTRHFQEDTAWGRATKNIEARTRAALKT
jgi:hypothetical protein